MSKQIAMPAQPRLNLLVNAIAFMGFILMALSGISFLVFPSNDTLSGLHAFGSVMTIAAIVIHIALHWQWVKMMTRRSVESLTSRSVTLPKSVRLNVAIDTLIAISFLVTAVSGVLLNQRSESSGDFDRRSFGSFQSRVSGKGLFGNHHDMGLFGNHQDTGLDIGNQTVDSAAGPAFQWATLDLIHLGAVITLVVLMALHIWMHRCWIVNVSRRLFVPR